LEGGRLHDWAQNTQETTNLHTMHKKYFNVPATKMANYNALDRWWMLHARVQLSALTKRPQSDVTGRHNALNFCLLYTESIFVDNRKLINKLIHTRSHKVHRTFKFLDHDRILRSNEHRIRIITSARI